jgi:hypothetical protein
MGDDVLASIFEDGTIKERLDPETRRVYVMYQIFGT